MILFSTFGVSEILKNFWYVLNRFLKRVTIFLFLV